MTDEIIVRRLVIIKSLYKLGITQAALPETISYTSILLLHDAIDMFMNLAAEKKRIKDKRQSLMHFYNDIPEMLLESSVEKINKRRNSLKHGGFIPGKVEIQDTCSIAKIFFEENTSVIFGKNFDDISLFDLIGYSEVRDFLKTGDSLRKMNDLENAAEEVAKAYFHVLLIEGKLSKIKDKNPWYDSEPQPLIDMDEGRFYTKAVEELFVGQDRIFKEKKTESGHVEISEGVASIAYNNNNKAFSYIFQSLGAIFLGLDYRKYNRYKSFMPQVVSLSPADSSYEICVPLKQPTLTDEDISFAIDFVMEFALKLQEFKY